MHCKDFPSCIEHVFMIHSSMRCVLELRRICDTLANSLCFSLCEILDKSIRNEQEEVKFSNKCHVMFDKLCQEIREKCERAHVLNLRNSQKIVTA